jgi:AcrR family transcriptional regulator/DNA-binding MarR family transcriptional regulator
MALPPAEDARVPLRRGGGVPGPRGGGVFLSRVQQTRLLDAAVAVVAEEGVKCLSATRVSGRAGMSTKTFYDLFADGEDCFLGVFDRAIEELAAAAGPVWAGEGDWVERVRGAVIVLLASIERDRALGKVVFVEALGAGPRVLARRAEVLDRAAGFIDEGRVGGPAGLPPLVAAPVAGAAFSVIHARLVQERPESLMEIVNPVVATVVLPYRGQEASARELARPVPELPVLPEPVEAAGSPVGGAGGGDVSPGVPSLDVVRPTERTLMVLASVAERGGANNRGVAAGAGIHDDAQISRLLARLEGLGLVENRGGGVAKAWWLTASGVEFLRTGPPRAAHERAVTRARGAGRGGSRSAGAGRRAGAGRGGVKRRAGRGVLLGEIDAVDYRRALLLRAAATAAVEHGYGRVTVAHITARAKISRRTFYELFADREECLLAVMADIDAQLTSELKMAGLEGLEWRERIRRGLWTVLRFFDREPVLARFCVVESARGEDRMAAYREDLLARITAVIAAGSGESLVGEASPLLAEGVAGAIVSILSTRLAATGRRVVGGSREDVLAGGLLSDLLGELMGLIVLPYLGSRFATRERERPAPTDPAPAPLPVAEPGGKQGGKYLALDPARSLGSGLRMTYRTALVLEAIANAPGTSNLDVARQAQVNDQGQISKLLSRLERNGLIQNTGRGQGQGAPNEWRLTPTGQKLQQDIREHSERAA